MKNLFFVPLISGAFAVAVASPAMAGLTDFSLYWSGEYQQTGPTTVVPYNSGTNYFFTSLADVASATDYDVNGLSVTTPPSNTYTMTGPSGSAPFIAYQYQSGYLTLSDLNTIYPAGTYTLNANNSSTSAFATVNLTYDGNAFFATPPQLTPSSFSGLAGLNPNQPYTIAFEPFSPTGGNYARIFLNIVDLNTDASVFSDTFLNTGTTQIVIPAGALLPNTPYAAELDFSTRTQDTNPATIDCTGSDPTQCPGLTELAWDSRTLADFTTGAGAVPEPSTWALMLIGFAGLSFAGYRRTNTRAASETA